MRFIVIIPVCLGLISNCLTAPSQFVDFPSSSARPFNINFNAPISVRTQVNAGDALRKNENPEAFRKFYEQSELRGVPQNKFGQQIENKPQESPRLTAPIPSASVIPEGSGRLSPGHGTEYFKAFIDEINVLFPNGNANLSKLPKEQPNDFSSDLIPLASNGGAVSLALSKSTGNLLTIPIDEPIILIRNADFLSNNNANLLSLLKGDTNMLLLPKSGVNSPALPRAGNNFPGFLNNKIFKENELLFSRKKSDDNFPTLLKGDANFPSFLKGNPDFLSLPKNGFKLPSAPENDANTQPLPKGESHFQSLPKGGAELLSLPKSVDNFPSLPKDYANFPSFLKENLDCLSLSKSGAKFTPLPKIEDLRMMLAGLTKGFPAPPQVLPGKAPEQRGAAPLPEPVKDTPEVAAARQAHLKTVAETASKSAEPVKDTPEVMTAREAHFRAAANPNAALPVETPKYTPEVQAAREAHFRAYALTAKLATESDVNPKILEILLGRPGETNMGPQNIEKLETFIRFGHFPEELKRLMIAPGKFPMNLEVSMRNNDAPKKSLPQPPGIINLAEKPQLKKEMKLPEVSIGTGIAPTSPKLPIPDTKISSLNEFEQSKLKLGAYTVPIETFYISDTDRFSNFYL